MRRRNWIFAVILSAGLLLAMAQAVWAEPDPAPENDPEPSTTTTTTQPRSTYDWEAETDEYGVTLYPPAPDVNGPDNGPTTTTIKTSRTSAPFQINPDHPEDVYTGALPNGNLPNFNQVATDAYGNQITRVITAPSTEEATTEEPTSTEEETTEEIFPEEPVTPARPLNWTLAAVAGGVLVAAAVGGIAVLARNKKDSDDDFIYAGPEDEQSPED